MRRDKTFTDAARCYPDGPVENVWTIVQRDHHVFELSFPRFLGAIAGRIDSRGHVVFVAGGQDNTMVTDVEFSARTFRGVTYSFRVGDDPCFEVFAIVGRRQ